MLVKKYRGDTIVEVCFALAVFSFLAVLAIGTMNSNLSTVQATLETTSVRNEIDAQTEAIRFIYNTYLAEHNIKSESDLSSIAKSWKTLTGNAYDHNKKPSWPVENCQSAYDSINGMQIINTRNLNGSDVVFEKNDLFKAALVNSRLLYNAENETDLLAAEGIWLYAVKSETKNDDNQPEFYDFYVQACWYNAGRSTPTTLDTTIRLSNPDYKGATS